MRNFRKLSIITTLIAIMLLAFPNVSYASGDLLDNTSSGVREYRIFRNNDATLTYGKQFAQEISGSEIAVVVVKEQDLNNYDPSIMAKLIQSENSDYYDTVLVVVNGETDTFYSYSTLAGFSDSLMSILGDSADNAGETLILSSGKILSSYRDHGGMLEGKSLEIVDSLRNNASRFIDDASAGVQDYKVYKTDGTDLTFGKEIAEKLSDTSIRIAILPTDRMADVDGQLAADTVLASGDYEAVIVVYDGDDEDQIYVASDFQNMKNDFIDEIGETSVEDAGTQIYQHTDALTGIYEQNAQEVASQREENFNNAITVGVVFIGVCAFNITIIAGLILLTRYIDKLTRERQLKKQQEKIAQKEQEQRKRDMFGMPENIYNLILELAELEEKVRKEDQRMGVIVRSFINHVKDLFMIADKNKIPSSVMNDMEVEYTDRITKILTLMGDKYFLSIKRNGIYWNNSKKKIETVYMAIKSMDELTLNNIRQINEHTNLDFNSTLRSLLNDSYNDEELEGIFNTDVSYKTV